MLTPALNPLYNPYQHVYIHGDKATDLRSTGRCRAMIKESRYNTVRKENIYSLEIYSKQVWYGTSFLYVKTPAIKITRSESEIIGKA